MSKSHLEGVLQGPELTAVRSELDSGLDTWWLLKKMVFLSGSGASEAETSGLKTRRAQKPRH